MNHAEVMAALQIIFRDVLDLPTLQLVESMDATQVENWDSLNHISLIIEIESRFGFSFDTAQLLELATVGDLARVIADKGKG